MVNKLLFAFIACVLSGLKRLREKGGQKNTPVADPTQQRETLFFGFLAVGQTQASVVNLRHPGNQMVGSWRCPAPVFPRHFPRGNSDPTILLASSLFKFHCTQQLCATVGVSCSQQMNIFVGVKSEVCPGTCCSFWGSVQCVPGTLLQAGRMPEPCGSSIRLRPASFGHFRICSLPRELFFSRALQTTGVLNTAVKEGNYL